MSDLKPDSTTVSSSTADGHVNVSVDEKKVLQVAKYENEKEEDDEEVLITQKIAPRKPQAVVASSQVEQNLQATQYFAKNQDDNQDNDDGDDMEEEVMVTQKAVNKKIPESKTLEDVPVTTRGKFSDLSTLRKQQLIDQKQDEGENKAEFTSMKTISNIDELLPAALDSALILYKEKRILCSQILNEYKQDYGDQKIIVKRASAKQIIVPTESTLVKPLSTTEDVEEFLKQHSKAYTHVIQVEELARGGEAVVYRLNHTGTDEVVVKTPLFKPAITKDELLLAYESIFYESQTLKMCPLKSSVCEIKEEIIEYNKEAQIITRYCAIVEKAEFTLSKLITIWNDEVLREQNMEWFTPEKLAYYFYQMMYAMQYMHQKRIFYSDMKGPNVLIFRSQQIKLGDLGISVRLNLPSAQEHTITQVKEDEENLEIYYGKGLTLGYVTDWYQECFENDVPLSMAALFECDQYALIQTLKLAITNVQQLQQETKTSKNEQPYYIQMLEDLTNGDLKSTLIKWTDTFREDWDFIQTLVKQLQKEQKHFAIENVLLLSKYHDEVYTLLKIQSQQNDMSVYDLIEEDKVLEEEEELILGDKKQQKLGNEKLIVKGDPVYKQMLITLLQSFNPETEYGFITKIFNQMAPCFSIKVEEITYDIDFILTFFKQDAQSLNNFKLIVIQNRNDIQDAILFKDAEISTAPKTYRANLMNFGMLPLIKFASYFKLHDIHAYLLLRASNIYFGKHESKSFSEECLLISRRVSRYDYIQQCKVNLAILANEVEVVNANLMLDEAEPQLIQLYGQHSLEYARFCSAKSHCFKLVKKFDAAISQSNKSLVIYQTLLGEGAIQTLDTYKELASLYKRLKQDTINTKNYENCAMKYVKSQYSDKLLDFQQFKIYANTNRRKLIDGIKNFEFGSLIYKCLAVSYFGLQQELPEYFIDGLINGSNFYDRVHNLSLATISQSYQHLSKALDHIQKDTKDRDNQAVSLDLYRRLCNNMSQQKLPTLQLMVSKYFGMMSDVFDKYFDDLEITLPYFQQMNHIKTKLYQIKIFYNDKGIIGLQSYYKHNHDKTIELPIRGKMESIDQFHVVNIQKDEEEYFTDFNCLFDEDSTVMEQLQLLTNKRIFIINNKQTIIKSLINQKVVDKVLIGFAGAQNTEIISQIYGWKIMRDNSQNITQPDTQQYFSINQNDNIEFKSYQQMTQDQTIVKQFKEITTSDPKLKKFQQNFIDHYNGMLVYIGQTNDFNIPQGAGKMIMKNGDLKEGFWKDGFLNGYGYTQNYEGLYQEGIWENDLLIEGLVEIPSGASFNITNVKKQIIPPQMTKLSQYQNIRTGLTFISNQSNYQEAILIWKKQVIFQAHVTKQPQKATYFRPHYKMFKGEIDIYGQEKNGDMVLQNDVIVQVKDYLHILRDKYGDIYYQGEMEIQNNTYSGTKYYYCSEGGCILYQGEFYNYKFDGKGTLFDIFGKKVYEGQWKQGYKQGDGIQFNSDGTILKEGIFNDYQNSPDQIPARRFDWSQYFKGYPQLAKGQYSNKFMIGHDTCYYCTDVTGNGYMVYEGLENYEKQQQEQCVKVCFRKFMDNHTKRDFIEEVKLIKNNQYLQYRRTEEDYQKKIIQNYTDNVLHGVYQKYYEGALIEQTIYENGIKNGPAKRKQNEFTEVFTYIDGLEQGFSQYFTSEQNIYREVYYKDGKEDPYKEMKNYTTGECRQIVDDTVYWYKPYNKNFPDIPITYPVSGGISNYEKKYEYQNCGQKSIVASFNILTGQFDGKIALYYLNGEIFVEGQLVNGIKDGNWIFRKDNGEPFMEIMYKDERNYSKMILANNGTKQIVDTTLREDNKFITQETKILYSNGAKFEGIIREWHYKYKFEKNDNSFSKVKFVNADSTGNILTNDIKIQQSVFTYDNITQLINVPGAMFIFTNFEIDDFLWTIEYEERSPAKEFDSSIDFEWSGIFDEEYNKWKKAKDLKSVQRK